MTIENTTQQNNQQNMSEEKILDLTVPQREKIAHKATKIRDKELREIGVYGKEPFTAGDVGSILKAINEIKLCNTSGK